MRITGITRPRWQKPYSPEKKEEKKEWESPEHKAIREAKLKAWQEMQELTNPANQDFKAVRIQDMMTMSF